MVKGNTKFKPMDIVCVKNNFPGILSYTSPASGIFVTWGEKGMTQNLTLQELQNMRNTNIAFFKNNWIVIDEEESEEIYKYLGVSMYYESGFKTAGDYTELYKMSFTQMKSEISKMSSGAKETVIVDVKNRIKSEKLDSIKKINQLSELLNVKFL